MRLDLPTHQQRRRSVALATDLSRDPQLRELVLPESEPFKSHPPDARDDSSCTSKLHEGNLTNPSESRDTSPSSSLSSVDEIDVGVGNISLKDSSVTQESDSTSDRYTKIGSSSVIGRGQFSCVNRAIDAKLMRLCAIKEVNVSNESNRGQAEAELQFVRSFGGVSVKHENIIVIHQTFVSHSTISFVMEYASMGSLQDVIDAVGVSQFAIPGRSTGNENVAMPHKSILPFSWISTIGKATFSALNFLHINNYAHFDVKPANILLFRSGNVKLTDFGCCKKLDATGNEILGHHFGAGGSCTTTGGTMAFLSPEQLLGSSAIGTKSDIFSTGITLLECVESSDQERCGYWDVLEITEMRTKEIGRRHDLPRPLQHLLLLCFSAEDDRPSADSLLEHDFFRSTKARITDQAFSCLAQTLSLLPRAAQHDINKAVEEMRERHGTCAAEATAALLMKELTDKILLDKSH